MRKFLQKSEVVSLVEGRQKSDLESIYLSKTRV